MRQENTSTKSSVLMRSVFVGALTLLFTMPLMAQEQSSVKLNLPDGVYGTNCAFIVKDNQFYTSPSAIKKFGVAKLNHWFAGKKFKVLFGGEKIGEGYLSPISDDIKLNKISTCDHIFGRDDSKPRYFNEEKIIKTPLYLKDSVFNNGTVMTAVTVPDAYKETPRMIYRSITPEEVATVEKLAQQQLLLELKSRKDLERAHGEKLDASKFNNADIIKAELVTLDKVFRHSQEMYIGTYNYLFRDGKEKKRYKVMFSTVGNAVKFITGFNEPVGISGMLDIDGCGEDELIIRKSIEGEDKYISWMEIYKQENNGAWVKIIRSKRIENSL
jgi:hypothetical protein